MHTDHGRNACLLQSFLFPIVLVSVSELLMMYFSVKKKRKKKASPQENVWTTGFDPNLFLTHNDW